MNLEVRWSFDKLVLEKNDRRVTIKVQGGDDDYVEVVRYILPTAPKTDEYRYARYLEPEKSDNVTVSRWPEIMPKVLLWLDHNNDVDMGW